VAEANGVLLEKIDHYHMVVAHTWGKRASVMG
jgi:hypothetical protein